MEGLSPPTTPAGAVAAVQLHLAARGVLLRPPVEQLGVKGRGAREIGALEFDMNDRGAGHSERPYQHVAKMAITATLSNAAKEQHRHLAQLDRRAVDVAGQAAQPAVQPECEA